MSLDYEYIFTHYIRNVINSLESLEFKTFNLVLFYDFMFECVIDMFFYLIYILYYI